MASSEIIKATVYVVRHGECRGNVEQVALDPFTDVLTEVGKTQAELLGKCLKKIPFSRAYASDYPRTFETAQIILRQNELCQESILQGEAGLRERGYAGIINWKASAAIGILTDAMKQGTPYLKVEVPDCETVKEFEDRIIKFFRELIQDLKKSPSNEENILIVSHGLTNQRLMVLLNQRAKDLGIGNWEPNPFSEKLMRNTTFHQIGLEIPREESSCVAGQVKHAHFREHVNGRAVDVNSYISDKEGVNDSRNYTFLDERKRDLADVQEETNHYCRPV